VLKNNNNNNKLLLVSFSNIIDNVLDSLILVRHWSMGLYLLELDISYIKIGVFVVDAAMI
jgi:hypothetical protein